MASKESSDKTGYVVSVKILDVEKRYNTGPKHYVYVMQITWAKPANVFIIYRRYAQFFELQCQLLDLFAETPQESNGSILARQIPFLPGKIILGRSQVRQIALERKDALNEYCETLISLPERVSRSRPILDFFHPLSTDVQKSVESTVQEKKSVDKSSLVISGPAKLATYRCLADFTATEKLEMSLKRNNVVSVLQKHANGWWFVEYGDQKGFVPGTYLQPSELKSGAREGKTIEKSLNEMHVVNNTYKGKGKDELSLDQGSFVTVIEKSLTGWWTVKFNNMTGQYPAIFLTSCEGRHMPENVTDGASSVTSKKKESNDSNETDWDVEDDYHMDPSKATEPELYYAHTDFLDKAGDCLSFRRGEIIEVHDKHSSGWWFGRRMKGGEVLTWIPANYLQKEPISNNAVANKNALSSNSKPPSKMPDKVPSPSVNKQQKEKETEKISTNTIRKNFESQAPSNVVHSTVVKKQQPIGTTTAQKQVPASAAVRPVNDKPIETTIAQRRAPTSTAIRPTNDKPIETTIAQRSTSASAAIRPVNNKPIEAAITQKKAPASAAVRSVNDKPVSTQKSIKDLVNRYNK